MQNNSENRINRTIHRLNVENMLLSTLTNDERIAYENAYSHRRKQITDINKTRQELFNGILKNKSYG